MSNFQFLSISRAGNVMTVTLNSPTTRNALSTQMVSELREAAMQCAQDSSLRCVVLRGAGGNFCAGGNFIDFQQMMQSPVPKGATDPIAVANREFGYVLQEWRNLPQVLIVVVEGAAMGGGVGLAAIADITLAAGDAQFAMPENNLGLPPAQIAPFVAMRIGQAQTRHLTLTAARIDGWQAREIGLVTEVLESATELDVALQKTLRAVLRSAPRALASTKAILNLQDSAWLDAALDAAALQFATALRNGDAAEGVSAYAAKRAAAWVELPPDPVA
jgi:isohexenylglutaconyl-CoA hydratase